MTPSLQHFREGPHSKAWFDLTATPMWIEATRTAQAELFRQFAVPNDPVAGAKLHGALAAITLLSGMATEEKPPIPQRRLRQQSYGNTTHQKTDGN